MQELQNKLWDCKGATAVSEMKDCKVVPAKPSPYPRDKFPNFPIFRIEYPDRRQASVILYEREMGEKMGEKLRQIKFLYNMLRARYTTIFSAEDRGKRECSVNGTYDSLRRIFFKTYGEVVSAMTKMYKYVIEEQVDAEEKKEMPTFQEIPKIVETIHNIEYICQCLLKLQEPIFSMRASWQEYLEKRKKSSEGEEAIF